MNILITGGFGFIGSNIANRYIEYGHNVTILSKTNRKKDNIIYNNYNLILKDIKDIVHDDLLHIDLIFHCASTVDNYNILSDPYLDANVNIIGTIALLEAAKNTNIRIIYTSTFFVTGNSNELPANNNTNVEPLALYGATKLCAEHILKTYNRVYNVDIVIARLSNVFGNGEVSNNNKKAALNRMIYIATHNLDVINLYDNGKIYRDYIFISDVIDALITLSTHGENNKVYYIGRGEAVQFRKIIDLIIKHTNFSNIKTINPPKFHKQVGIDNFYCNISDLKKLGWSPKVSLEDGIIKTIKGYKNGN